MPTVLKIWFYFFSNDHLPIYIHMGVDNMEARFQVRPEIKLIEKTRELRWAEAAIEENREVIIARWKKNK